MKKPILLLPLLLLVPACSGLSAEGRIRDRLETAGMKPEMAQCVAAKLVRKLDSSELRQLGEATKLPRENVGRMSFDELAERLRAIDNPHIASVVTRVGLGCAIAG